MAETLASLAELVGGEARGDPARILRRVRALDAATAEDLSFLTNRRYLDQARSSKAGALLVGEGVEGLPQDLLVAAEPYLALARILNRFTPDPEQPQGVHSSAVVSESAAISTSASIGPYCVIGERVSVGEGTRIGAHCVLGDDVVVGSGCTLHPRVTLYARSEVGARCILHSGVVVGADGYGFATSGGAHHKLPHIGRAVLEDDVEVGANSTIDRALLGETRVGAGTKIDDLVMVAHNVQVGRGCLLVAQAGIAGSARLGDFVTVAGQSGIIGHVEVGDGVVVATKSAVLQGVDKGRQVAGIPAVDLPQWRRQQALIRRLGDLRARLLRLERERERPDYEDEE